MKNRLIKYSFQKDRETQGDDMTRAKNQDEQILGISGNGLQAHEYNLNTIYKFNESSFNWSQVKVNHGSFGTKKPK